MSASSASASSRRARSSDSSSDRVSAMNPGSKTRSMRRWPPGMTSTLMAPPRPGPPALAAGGPLALHVPGASRRRRTLGAGHPKAAGHRSQSLHCRRAGRGTRGSPWADESSNRGRSVLNRPGGSAESGGIRYRPPARRHAPADRADQLTTGKGALATGKLLSSTVVRLPGGPLEARPDLTLAEWALLSRVDGRRPLTALANRSGRGQGEATALAERLIAAGVLELAGEPDEAGTPQQAATPSTEPDGPATAAEGESAAKAEPTAETEMAGAAFPDGMASGDQSAADGEEEGDDTTPAPGQARIDPVSLLRELAADAAEAPPAASEPEGRGAEQAEFLREFASLAMGGAPSDDPEPASQPDEEPSDDDRGRGRGRLGF